MTGLARISDTQIDRSAMSVVEASHLPPPCGEARVTSMDITPAVPILDGERLLWCIRTGTTPLAAGVLLDVRAGGTRAASEGPK